ncbi:MAG: UDP-N-acetylenolpyruvoylglucosamine reductase [Candidatus Parcubacteria bacterium]|nr:MAG: UDP-N-acetylenolpyruvoylglucosamine reductase [Candidatus Parcubacteria bacterium]
MKIIKNKKLAPLTSFKIGDRADYFVEIHNLDEFLKFHSWQKKKNLPIFVLGGGTNLLIDSFPGIVLKPEFKYIYKIDQGILKVGAGVSVSELLDYVIGLGYRGLEWAGGLPGTVGGAIEGGVGCFGGEFKNLVSEVLAVNLKTGEDRIFKKEECQFEYRGSFFRRNKDWLIVETTLIFETGHNEEELKKIAKEKIDYRKQKHPLEYPNAGSIFKNVPFDKAPKFIQDLALEKNKIKNDPFLIIPTAFLISELGLKGKRIGDAQISEKHSNFIINLGKATFADVYNLIYLAKKTLEDKFLIEPEIEIKIIK